MKFSSGIYFLYFGLKEGQELTVGRLGMSFFPRGFYVYIGSAQKNLAQRIERHLRKEKSHHWHIDYLLPHAKILSIHVFKASKEWECRLSRRLAGLEGARVVMKGFGSSDCRCPSHLYYFPLRPHLGSINLLEYRIQNKEFRIQNILDSDYCILNSVFYPPSSGATLSHLGSEND